MDNSVFKLHNHSLYVTMG